MGSVAYHDIVKDACKWLAAAEVPRYEEFYVLFWGLNSLIVCRANKLQDVSNGIKSSVLEVMSVRCWASKNAKEDPARKVEALAYFASNCLRKNLNLASQHLTKIFGGAVVLSCTTGSPATSRARRSSASWKPSRVRARTACCGPGA